MSNGNELWLHIRLARLKFEIAPAILGILYDYNYQLPKKSAAYVIAVANTFSDSYDIEKGFAEIRSGHGGEYCFDAEEFYCIGLSCAWEKCSTKPGRF